MASKIITTLKMSAQLLLNTVVHPLTPSVVDKEKGTVELSESTKSEPGSK